MQSIVRIDRINRNARIGCLDHFGRIDRIDRLFALTALVKLGRIDRLDCLARETALIASPASIKRTWGRVRLPCGCVTRQGRPLRGPQRLTQGLPPGRVMRRADHCEGRNVG